MWPYNYCEWKTITYGVKKVKDDKYKRLNQLGLFFASVLPSVILVWLIVTYLFD